MGAAGINHDLDLILNTTRTGPVIRTPSGASGYTHVRQDLLTGTEAPTVNYDSVAGYEVGSRVYNLNTSQIYECFDASSGAAVWVCTTTTSAPAGSGTELQYRSSASAFGAITGSSWDGATLTLPGVVVSTSVGQQVGIGSGTLSSSYKCHFYNDAVNDRTRLALFESQYGDTQYGVASLLTVKFNKTGAVYNNAGPGILFAYENATSGEKFLGRVACQTDGEITAGKLQFDVAVAGTLTTRFTVAGSDVSALVPLSVNALTGVPLTVQANSVNALVIAADKSATFGGSIITPAESYVGPTSTTGVYFKGGNVGIGTTSPGNILTVTGPTTADTLADVMIGTSATTQTGLVIQGKAGQTANLQQWQASDGNIVGRIQSNGSMGLGVASGNRLSLSVGVAASGELPAGNQIATNNADSLVLLTSANSGTAGTKVELAYYSASPAAWHSALEVENVAAGFGNLSLMRAGGNVGIVSTTPGGSGTVGTGVLSLGNGTAPVGGVANQASLFAADVVAGNSCIQALTESGDIIKLFKGAALTAEDASVVDGTYGAEEAAVIGNLRTRIGELAARLIANGLIAA